MSSMSSVSRNATGLPHSVLARARAGDRADRAADQRSRGDAVGGRPGADVATGSGVQQAVSFVALYALVSRPGECPSCPALTPRPMVPTTSRPCPVHVVLDHLPLLRRTLTTPARTPQALALRNNDHRFGDLLQAVATQSAWSTQEWAVARETLAAAIADDPVLRSAPVICYAVGVCSQACHEACRDRSTPTTAARVAKPVRTAGGAQ